MRVSLKGLLGNVADELEGGRGTSVGGRAHALRELRENLTELRDRTAKGDYAALDEFFAIYVDVGQSAYTRPPVLPVFAEEET